MEERPISVSHALGFDLSGHVLDGRYQITRKIGVGGMAAVYEARRIGLDRRFAIKIMRPELAEQESNVKRFLREARSAAAIEHPNIVSIVDVGESSKPVYFVMEYLDGVDLRHVIRSQGRQDWPRTRARALQIVAALAAAHARGIVHRDVKPANCFLVRDDDGRERVKVLDFGIAKVLEESQDYTNVTATHGIVGTVAYMAPEQAKSGTVDKRTDVYALGTMIYEMLAGTVPFPDKNPFVALSRQLAEIPVGLREHRPDLSVEVEAIVMTCLAKAPDERFQSMEALGGALEAVGADPVVWTGPMIAASPADAAPSGSAPVAHAHAHAHAMAAAVASGPSAVSTLPAHDAKRPGPHAPTEVLPQASAAAKPASRPPEDATPTFPLLPDAGAPVAHGREAAAPMPAALRSSAVMPVVRGQSRPRSSASPAAGSSSSAATANHGLAGLVVGAIGMLALGGTVMWWALHEGSPSDGREAAPVVEPRAPDVAPESPPPSQPLPSVDTTPPEPTPPEPTPPEVPPADAETPPDVHPPESHPDARPRTRPKTTPHDPKAPDPAPKPPPPEAKTATDPKNPDVAPGLRNPFTEPKH